MKERYQTLATLTRDAWKPKTEPVPFDAERPAWKPTAPLRLDMPTCVGDCRQGQDRCRSPLLCSGVVQDPVEFADALAELTDHGTLDSLSSDPSPAAAAFQAEESRYTRAIVIAICVLASMLSAVVVAVLEKT